MTRILLDTRLSCERCGSHRLRSDAAGNWRCFDCSSRSLRPRAADDDGDDDDEEDGSDDDEAPAKPTLPSVPRLDPQAAFSAAVAAKMATGLDRRRAIATVVREQHALHQAYLTQVNAGRRAGRR